MPRKKKALLKDEPLEHFLLRIPPATKAKIAQIAKKEGRSINSQIVYLLEQTLSQSSPQNRANRELQKKVDDMEALVFKIARTLNRLYAQSIDEVEELDPEIYEYYSDEIDQLEVASRLAALKKNMIPVEKARKKKKK